MSDLNISGNYLKNGTNILSSKQDTLVSGTNIKTINGTSVLGSGDLTVGGGGGGIMAIVGPSSMYGGQWISNMITAGGQTNITYNQNQVYYFPFFPAVTLDATQLQFNLSSGAVAGALARVGIYDNNPTSNIPNRKQFESSDLDMSTTGLKTITFSYTFEAGTLYWFAYQGSVNLTITSCLSYSAAHIAFVNTVPITQWAQVGLAYGLPATASPNTYQTSGPPVYKLK